MSQINRIVFMVTAAQKTQHSKHASTHTEGAVGLWSIN